MDEVEKGFHLFARPASGIEGQGVEVGQGDPVFYQGGLVLGVFRLSSALRGSSSGNVTAVVRNMLGAGWVDDSNINQNTLSV